MLLSMILFLTSTLLASSTPPGEVKVIFTCPGQADIRGINWENELNLPYTEDPGEGGSKKLYVDGMNSTPASKAAFSYAARQGQVIRCIYRHGELWGNYKYSINRQVISCTTSGRQIHCKLKP